MAQATDENTTRLHLVDPIQLRARMSEAVERLLAALDALDAVTEDQEDESDDDTEQEPSLGAIESAGDQSHAGIWKSPFSRHEADLEHEHDGREPEDDIGDLDGLIEQTAGEPSLGSFDRMLNQEKSYRQTGTWTNTYGEDAEQDDADREPSLGALEYHPSALMGGFSGRSASGHQLGWAHSNRDDREDEHDGREPEIE